MDIQYINNMLTVHQWIEPTWGLKFEFKEGRICINGSTRDQYVLDINDEITISYSKMVFKILVTESRLYFDGKKNTSQSFVLHAIEKKKNT